MIRKINIFVYDIKYFIKLFYAMFFLNKIEQLRRKALGPVGRPFN